MPVNDSSRIGLLPIGTVGPEMTVTLPSKSRYCAKLPATTNG